MRQIIHGGDLPSASREFSIPIDSWVDVSTGISPWSWPVPDIPESVWRCLPYDNTALLNAAEDYYGCQQDSMVAVPGTQMPIKHIPRLLSKARVAIPSVGYAEHAAGWQQAGHEIVLYDSFAMLQDYVTQQSVDHAVLINPNNPTAERVAVNDVLLLHKQLSTTGILLVDEAFMDWQAHNSVIPYCDRPGLYVLRSIGKFFGLAGLRLGFLIGQGELLNNIRSELQPWGVSHPALWLVAKALADKPWHDTQKQRITHAERELVELLQAVFPSNTVHYAGLFATIMGEHTELQRIYTRCAQQAVLIRYGQCAQYGWLRFGLPGEDFAVLQNVLRQF